GYSTNIMYFRTHKLFSFINVRYSSSLLNQRWGPHTGPKAVKIVEVSPRDGLQNEKQFISTENKIEFINKLSQTGLKVVETTSFVSPKLVPQMSDATEVIAKITRKSDVDYPVLVPNLTGLKKAILSDVKEIAIFASASETF
ncbi:12069_t:CDS:2, partial [Cetraspora pellucida]